MHRTALACCADEPIEDVSGGTWAYESRRHYMQPAWWRYSARQEEDVRAAERPVSRSAAPASRDVHQREHVTARGGEPDYSPHQEGRAQPGDVLGIESGGETTAIGDTAEDENERRRTAERATGGPAA